MDLFSYLLGKSNGGGGGSSLDWSAIGYSEEPETGVKDDYIYAKSIYDSWDNTQTSLAQKFYNNKKLVIMPLVDTSKAESKAQMFMNCERLTIVPILDMTLTVNDTRKNNMFHNCNYLTNESLDNILQMCIAMPLMSGSTKTLSSIGISSSYYPVSRIQALPHYQDFINAGWTIGY